MGLIGGRRRALELCGAAIVVVALMVAPASADKVRGTPKDDRLHGGPRADLINGRAGDDRLSGRRGRDVLKGGVGNDVLIGGKAYDAMVGGPGDDVIRARDGMPDLIECGDGADRAIVDAIEDGVYDCEEVIEP